MWQGLLYEFARFLPGMPFEKRLRLGEVEPKKLYRSAQPSEDDLERLVVRYGLRALVVARIHFPPYEKFCADRYNLRHLHLLLLDDMPTQEMITGFLNFVSEPAHHPVLLHCRHGRDRTGIFSFIYRVEVCKWQPEDAWREMRAFGHSWLFGRSHYKNWIEQRYRTKLSR